MRSSSRLLLAALPLTLAGSGCGVILGIDDFTDAPSTTGTTTTSGGSGGTAGSTSSGGTSSSGGSTSSGGNTTSSGGGGTGGMVCAPNTLMDCYDGPEGTEGVGACKHGTQKCKSDGSGYEACNGQVVPADAENCALATDDDCNGVDNLAEGCCVPNTPTECYTGPVGTKNKGVCAAGNVTCNADGTFPVGCPGQVLPSDEYCATTEDDDCNGKNCFLWTVAKGGFGQEYGASLGTEFSSGSIVVGGSFKGSLNLGGGVMNSAGNNQNDAFLAVFAADGTHTWSKKFGMDGAEAILGATYASNGGIAIVGYYLFGDVDFGGGALGTAQNFDGFFARFDGAGTHLFSRSFGGTGNQAASALKPVSGGILVAGTFEQTTVFGNAGDPTTTSAGATDGFLALYDSLNELVWSTTFGGTGSEGIAGSVSMDADFGSGRAYVAGTTTSTGFSIGSTMMPTGTTGYLAQVNPAGTITWAKGFNTGTYPVYVASSTLGPYVATTVQASVDMGGGPLAAFGGNDIVVAHFDSNGTYLWSKIFGGTGDQSCASIAADSSGLLMGCNYAAAFTLSNGQTLPSPAVPGGGAFVMKLDGDGAIVWAHAQGGEAPTVALDGQDFAIMTGGFFGSSDFGGGAVAAVGATDFFLGKLGK